MTAARIGWLVCALAGPIHAAEPQEMPVPELPTDPELTDVPPPIPAPTGPPSDEARAAVVTVSLTQAVRTALERNFGILAATDQLQASRIGASASLAEFFPKLTPGYERRSNDVTQETDHRYFLEATQKLPWTGGTVVSTGSLRTIGEGAESRSTDLRVSLLQPLLRGFGPNATFFNLRNARRALQGQERGYLLARQALAVQVAQAFFQVIRQRQLLNVARQSRQRGFDLQRQSEARMKAGLASKLDVFRAELQASQAEEAMISSETALETALEEFRVVLGLSPTDIVEPEEVPLADTIVDDVEPLPVLVARAFDNREELREAQDQVEDARRSASLARQSLLPQLDLNVSLTRSGVGPSLGESFSASGDRVDVFLSTTYPVERANDRAQAAVARLGVVTRERALTQRRLEIEAEVRASVRNLERIRKSVELQRKGLEFAEQQHRLATLRYQRGLAPNFDVVDAEGNLVSARTALVSLLTDYEVARISLERVTGTLDVDAEFGP